VKTKLVRFLDDDSKGRWANITMDNGDPCWISVAQTGVLVKKSKIGLFGAKLYEETNLHEVATTAFSLSTKYPHDLTPDGMKNPIFKHFVNAVLHCKTLGEVSAALNRAT